MTALNDARWWNNTLDARHLLGAGLMYEVGIPEFGLAGGFAHSFGGVTGDFPVYIHSTAVFVIGSRNVRVERFAGGTISGGTTRPQLPRNHFRPTDPTPFVSIEDDVSVDVAGTLISVANFSDANPLGLSGGFIYAPGTVYYTTVTNDDNQAADSIEVSQLMARYRDRLP